MSILSNTPTLTATRTPTRTPTNTATITPTRTPTSTPTMILDVAISKTSDGKFKIGADVVYDIEVVNTGNLSTVGPITVTDTLPGVLTFVSVMGPGWDCTATVAPDISCTHPGPLLPGDPPLTLTLIATINDGALIVANTAIVFTPMDTVEPNNTDTFVFALDTPAPVLSMPTLVGLIALLSLVGYFGLYREPLRAKSKRPGPPS